MEFLWRDITEMFGFLMQHLIIINCILSIVIIFFQRKNPTAVWTWLLLLYFIPIVGFIFYLLIGGDMHKRKMFRTKEVEDSIHEAIRSQEASIRTKELQQESPHLKKYSDLIYYNLESAGAVFTDNNQIKVFTDGNAKFSALLADMKQAKEHIHIQYYIVKDDVVFQRIKDVLLEKVKEGVEVRILYDGMGGGRFVKRKRWQELQEKGIMTAEFFPAWLGRLQLRINYRNHRKIVVIDGKTAYVGGFNIGKEYIGLDSKFGYWRDTHLRIEGTAAAGLQVRFILDWNYAAKQNLLKEEKYFKVPKERVGDCEMQIISSGPDSQLQHIRNNYLRLISKAEKSIYIQTPYFIPDDAIFSALTVAAYSGVEVNIMIPCMPDHPFVYWATYSYIGDMVMAGAKCYTYNNGFLHAKGLVADGKAYCYGTANMDIRSFKLNFEVNAIVYNEREAEKMVDIFQEDLKFCKQVTKDVYAGRSLIVRGKEQACRLLSPLL